jgi:transposase
MAVPWAGKHSRFTLAFEAFAIKVLLASRSVKSACELLKISWEAAHSIMERAVERGMDRRVLEKLETVGMDEKSFLRGQSYATVLYDLDAENTRVLEMMEGRDADTAELLWETVPELVRESIKAVCLDMSGIYKDVAAFMVPQAAVVVRDGFHHVFELGADDRVIRRKVQTGRRAGERIEITGGLAPAARVVVAGAGFLNDGDRVRVVTTTPSPPAAR